MPVFQHHRKLLQFLRQVGLQHQFFACQRVVEVQLGSVQEHPFQTEFLEAFVGLIVAVAFVAGDGAVLRLEVDADLVGAPRFQGSFDQGQVREAGLVQEAV